MSVQLRPYQEEAISVVISTLIKERHCLLQAATGAGKTIMFCELIRRWLSEWDMRIAIVAHRRELITQAADKLFKVWPGAPIGLACSSVTSNSNLNAPVVIGSVQTLVRRAQKRPFHLLIIDEAHRIPPRGDTDDTSQYLKLIERLETLYPELRILGVTATPYRLGHGYIYGAKCRKDRTNLWPRLDYSISISDLQAQGYLVPIRAKEAETLDLSKIKTAGGDYNLGQLEDLMVKRVHISTAVEAYRQFGEDRKHVVVFGVSIKHAELLRDAFNDAGYPAGTVHSEMNLGERDRILRDFATGRLQVLTNMGVLTEGWDRPETDLILLCRPTKSSALFVQMVGRGTRISPGKQDLLVLDLSNNFTTHGDPDSPTILIPGDKKTDWEPPMKACPKCKTLVGITTLECPECGHIWDPPEIVEEERPVTFRDIPLGPRQFNVINVSAYRHISNAGNKMLRLELVCKNGGPANTVVNQYLDIEGNASPFARQKARGLWYRLAGTTPPGSMEEALARFSELKIPQTVSLKYDGKWPKVVGW